MYEYCMLASRGTPSVRIIESLLAMAKKHSFTFFIPSSDAAVHDEAKTGLGSTDTAASVFSVTLLFLIS